MTAEEAITDATRLALEMLATPAERPSDVVARLIDVTKEDLCHIIEHLALENVDPKLAAERMECARDTARGVAAAALLVYALSGWADDVPAPTSH